ncbi:MAG: DEAD/DEAH box helicase [Planctomycetota bacterium]
MSDSSEQATFSEYGFDEHVLKDIREAGFETPTPVQAAFIPLVLEGKDVIGSSQTGTGKTAAFALPIIHRHARRMEMTTLVIAPTRELAQQIAVMFNQLGKSSGIRVAVTVGGIPMDHDYKALSSWPNILVATPGRLIDHIRSRAVVLTDVETLVVDEADRMHDMGFIPQVQRIIAELPQERQTLMLTATMPEDVEQIARRHMRNPVRVQIGRRAAPAARAKQELFHVNEDNKTALLLALLKETSGRVLIFVRTKRGVNRLGKILAARLRQVTHIHSGRLQSERDDAIAGFRDKKYRILVATDVAARGLDIADIEHVINYDLPQVPEDYVHRIGRTARVAASGRATSFVTRADRHHLARLQRLLGEELPLRPWPDGGERKRQPSKR